MKENIPIASVSKGYHFRRDLVFSSAGEASRFFRKAFLDDSGAYSVRFTFEGDTSSSVKKALRHAPVLSYRYSYNDSQRTALIWSV